MAKKGKITKVGDFKEYKGQNGTVYYTNIEFDNGDKGNIGVKDKAKIFVGKELDYSITQDDKGNNKIKAEVPFPAKAMGAYNDKTGMMVGNAITNATLLVAHGIIQYSELADAASDICDLSIKLKEKFKDK